MARAVDENESLSKTLHRIFLFLYLQFAFYWATLAAGMLVNYYYAVPSDLQSDFGSILLQFFAAPSLFAHVAFAVGLVTLLLAGLIVLPFVDRGVARHPKSRPIYTTAGTILVAELIALTVWGYFTPGQIIPDAEAVEVIGVVALVAALVSASLLRIPQGNRRVTSAIKPLVSALVFPLKNRKAASVFVILLCVGSVCFANLVGFLSGNTASSLSLALSLTGLITTFYAMVRVMRSMTAAYGRSQQ